MVSKKFNTTQLTKRIFFLKKQKHYYQNKRKYRVFLLKKKTSRKKINKWLSVFTPIIFITNNTTPHFMFKIKNTFKHRRFTFLRKRVTLYGCKLDKKNFKWRWWKAMRIDQLKLWYLINFITKTKTFKNVLIPRNQIKLNNHLKDQKKRKLKKKKIKFLKNFLVTDNLQTLKLQIKKLKINTSVKLQANTRSYINFLINNKRVKLKYTSLRYERRHFFDKNILLFEEMPIVNQIDRLKYHDKQKPLRKLAKIIRVLSWINNLSKCKYE